MKLNCLSSFDWNYNLTLNCLSSLNWKLPCFHIMFSWRYQCHIQHPISISWFWKIRRPLLAKGTKAAGLGLIAFLTKNKWLLLSAKWAPSERSVSAKWAQKWVSNMWQKTIKVEDLWQNTEPWTEPEKAWPLTRSRLNSKVQVTASRVEISAFRVYECVFI